MATSGSWSSALTTLKTSTHGSLSTRWEMPWTVLSNTSRLTSSENTKKLRSPKTKFKICLFLYFCLSYTLKFNFLLLIVVVVHVSHNAIPFGTICSSFYVERVRLSSFRT